MKVLIQIIGPAIGHCLNDYPVRDQPYQGIAWLEAFAGALPLHIFLILLVEEGQIGPGFFSLAFLLFLQVVLEPVVLVAVGAHRC